MLGVVTAAFGQEAILRIHTKPILPSRETLDRLDLTLAWKIKVPMDSVRDGFYSLQMFPGKTAPLMVAQTYQGAVVAINAETGDILWRTLIGRPFEMAQPVAINSQTVFACRREVLYALDRDSGKQVLYTAEPNSRVPAYGMSLESTPSAGLAADDEFLLVPLTNRLLQLEVPNFRAELKKQKPTPSGLPQDSPQLNRGWSFSTTGLTILQPAIIWRTHVSVITVEGSVFVIDTLGGATITTFKAEGNIKGITAVNKSVLYIPSEDYFLYAFDSGSGRLLWRFPGQSHIMRSPVATDKDVYVAPSGTGLYRLDQATGNVKWNQRNAVRFLANNKRFVYTMDKLGQVLVLDYDRGKELARWDTRDWVVPVSNDMTDRIYLAANDGQIICMHHRESIQPLKVKTFDELKPLPQPKKEEKKDDNQDPTKNGTPEKGPGGPTSIDDIPARTEDVVMVRRRVAASAGLVLEAIAARKMQ
jgi:outer membrane protein assembly factor BamB